MSLSGWPIREETDPQADPKIFTKMSRLPFLISIPHGGTDIPEELKSRIALSPQELLADGDPYTGDIYNMGDHVVAQLKCDVARALVDVNRAPDDLPPGNPDGVLKAVSIFNNPVYQNGEAPGKAEINLLLSKYYTPYHVAIQEALSKPGIFFAFDCHSMETVGPSVARDAGSKRPLFCLGNNNGKACSEKDTQLLAECLCKSFELPGDAVTMNEPFSGGYITRKYGKRPIPWIQIEMNRSLYLKEYSSNGSPQLSSDHIIQKLNSCFLQALTMFSADTLRLPNER